MKYFLRLIWVFLISTLSFGVDSFTYSPQIETVNECGLHFSKVSLTTSNPKIRIYSRSIQVADFKVSLPAIPTLDIASKGAAAAGSTLTSTLPYPLYPDIPLAGSETEKFSSQPLPNPGGLSAHCRYLKNYYAFAMANPHQAETAFLGVRSSKGTTTLTLKSTTRTFTTAQESAARTGGATTQGFEHLIIYDPLYEAEAFRLRNFRNQVHTISTAISIQSLPGYNSSDPVPNECQGTRYEECYFDPRIMNYPGVSKEAVPALSGYRNDIVAGDPYDKVSFIPGIIRA